MAEGSIGTTKQATLGIINSFFRDQRFPDNWFRAAVPVVAATNGATVAELFSGVGVQPGRNNDEGVYVADPPPPAPFDTGLVRCMAFRLIVGLLIVFQDLLRVLGPSAEYTGGSG